MTQIDATGEVANFDAFNASDTDYHNFVASNGNFLQWQTTGGYSIITLSYAGDLSPAPLGGTVDAIEITDSGGNAAFSITGLHVALIDLLDTGNAVNMQQKFWGAVLAGNTSILTPTTPDVALNLMGDFFTVSTGQHVTGGNDTFTGDNYEEQGTYTGDAVQVESGGVLHGGNDKFNGAVASNIIGDVGSVQSGPASNFGTVDGGDDTVAIKDLNYIPELGFNFVIGDVDFNGVGGVVHGGDDKITLLNIGNVSNVVGDNASTQGSDTGGKDTIVIETTTVGRPFASVGVVSGDDNMVDGSGGTITAKGGDDTITVKNANVTIISGDFLTAEDAKAVGGDDTIVVRGTYPEMFPPPPFAVTPTVEFVNGDADAAPGTHPFTGGNDTITLSDVIVENAVVGDARSVAALSSFTGGDDTISYTYDRTQTGAQFTASGDAQNAASAAFRGGDDKITVHLAASTQPATIMLYGDAGTYSASAGGNFVGGNDTLIADTAANQMATLFGDASSAAAGGNLKVHDGDDTLAGGAGNDVLYGDSQNVSAAGTQSVIGGDDVLDGRGGNDQLYGGAGVDTAVFSLARSVYVDLEGIGGSPYDAIGQGNDELSSIENVTGSSKNDVILGSSGANTLIGGDGNDELSGRGGKDVLEGGAGKDTLTGGAEADTFVFDTKLDATTNVDTIVDFKPGTDHIELDHTIFAGTGTAGTAVADVRFHIGASADTQAERIIYDSTTGALYYDKDGDKAGGVAQVEFATLHPGLSALQASDFLIA